MALRGLMNRKDAKIRILLLARGIGLFAISRRLTSTRIRILCYHGVWLGPDNFQGDSMFMKAATFERRLDLIQKRGYEVITLDHAIALLDGRKIAASAPIVITIDDGWYSTYAAMLPALRSRDLPATLYCDTAQLESEQPIAHVLAHYLKMLAPPSRDSDAAEKAYADAMDRARSIGERMAATRKLAELLEIDIEQFLTNRVFDYMTREECARAAALGLDIQLHTHNHSLHDFSEAEIREEIQANRRALAALLNRDPLSFRHFCYPSGVTNAKAIKPLENLGLISSTTLENGIAGSQSPRHLLPRILDGEQNSEIEFEAELSGFSAIVRSILRRLCVWPADKVPPRL